MPLNSKIRSHIYLCIILFLSLYLRLRYVIYTPFQFKIDAWSMYHYALNVAGGQYYGHCFGEHWARYAYWPPLYIFLSGFVYRFMGTEQDFLALRLIQALLSSASCLLCYAISSTSLVKYCNLHREAGLAAGILMAVNPRMIVYTNHLYVETVFITIYLAAVYLAIRLFNGFSHIRHVLGFSLLVGIGCLIRPVLLLLPLVLLVSLLLYAAAAKSLAPSAVRTLFRDTLLIYLIMLAVFLPWTLRNYAVTGRVILIDTNGPINFYIAHNPLASGQWVDVKPYTDINRLYETGYREGLAYLSRNIPREIQLARVKQGLFLYEEDPHVAEAAVYLGRAYRLPLYGSLIRMGIIKKDALDSFYKLPRMSFTLLWIVFLALLLLAVLRLTAAGSLHIIFREPSWIIGNLLYNNLIIQLFYFAPRYRITAEPFLCIGIGVFAAAALTLPRNIAGRTQWHHI